MALGPQTRSLVLAEPTVSNSPPNFALTADKYTDMNGSCPRGVKLDLREDAGRRHETVDEHV